MKRKLGKILKIVIMALLVIALVVASSFFYTVWRSHPQASGTINLPGLQAKVEIRRDRWGVPNIYAQTSHDLFMAQGYVHASDRFWQMDFWRHIGSGRLAEMFGTSQVKTDAFLRTVGWERIAKQEFANLKPEISRILLAYAEGVNAYLQNRDSSEISLEYAVLKLMNPSYKIEPWHPIHTLTWGKVMAWDLGGNLRSEIERTVLLKTLSLAQVEELFPPYPSDRPIILPAAPSPAVAPTSSTETDPLPTLTADILTPVAEQISALEQLIGKPDSDIGSNNWVIAGWRSATGKPILANDPHLTVQIPSIWYEIGLHCSVKTPDCPYEVTGFSFPSMLGIIIGHNDFMTWGVTNTNPDVMDLYIEKINPQNPNQYEVNGQWVDMEVLEEQIQVANSKPVTQTVRYTRHGPIISDTYAPLNDFGPSYGMQFPDKYAIALKWTALEPSRLVYAIPAIDAAHTRAEFRAAVASFDVPAQNFVYIDPEGNIGYQMPGKVPIRAKGDGRYPARGWTNEYEWQGYIPFERLPNFINPPSGFIVTANNAVVGKDYPLLITKDWDYGSRAQRIVTVLDQLSKNISVADIQRLQMDNRNLNAETLVPILLQVNLNDANLEEKRRLLDNWDFQQTMNGAAPALFQAFWKHLLAATFHDQLPEAFYPSGGDRWVEIVRNIVKRPDSIWWDDLRTNNIRETRDEIFRQAFANAVAELEKTLGKNPQKWRWGDLHTTTFRNATLGKSGIGVIEALFNRGPMPTSGGSAIVNATAWNAATGYKTTALPSMRMIIDTDDWEKSVSIHVPGQSGHAFHKNYDDMVELWRAGKYHPMLWKRNVVEENATDALTLVPQ